MHIRKPSVNHAYLTLWPSFWLKKKYHLLKTLSRIWGSRATVMQRFGDEASRIQNARVTHNCSHGFHFVSQYLLISVYCTISAICKASHWGLCGKCKVIVMLASQSSHCPQWKKELCFHQCSKEAEATVVGKRVWQLRATVHHQYHHPCLFVLFCSYWLCSFNFLQVPPCLVWMVW